MIPSQAEFLSEIQSRNLGLSAFQAENASKFAYILHRENENQNLTRILGVKEFIEGHLIDVIELLKLPTLGKRVLDVGSGSGVPGLLAAAIDEDKARQWILTESELMKAEYLNAAAEEIGLENVSIAPKRAEEVINLFKPDTVMARAVGTVEKIAGWVSICSTWNNLILFKSKGWKDEWEASQKERNGKKLTVTHMHDYSNSDRTRYLISLKRNR